MSWEERMSMALDQSKLEMIRDNLDSHDVTERDEDGATVLHTVCSLRGTRLDEVDLVETILERGADVEAAKDSTGDRPLHIACRRGNVAVVDLLLSNGANPLARNHSGQTPLLCACQGSRLNMVDFLLDHAHEHKIEVTAVDENGVSLLHTLCDFQVGDIFRGGEKRKLELLEKLLRHISLEQQQTSDFMNATDKSGQAALHLACHRDDPGYLQILSEHGANLDICDKFGETCLHHACLNGHIKTVRELLRLGANPCIQNHNGSTPLHLACSNGPQTETVRLLLQHGGIPLLQAVNHRQQNTALHVACSWSCIPTIRELLAFLSQTKNNDNIAEHPVVDILQMANVDGLTPVMIASLQGTVETVLELVRYDVSHNGSASTMVLQKSPSTKEARRNTNKRDWAARGDTAPPKKRMR